MEIKEQPVNSIVETDCFKEFTLAKKSVTVIVPGSHFSLAFQERKWDGTKSFLHKHRTPKNVFRGHILTGLIPFVTETVEGVKVIKEKDDYPLQYRDETPSTMPPLRDYQKRALQVMCSKRRGIVNLATNAGKTEICAAFSYLYTTQLTGKVLYLCYGTTLVKQAFERYRKYFGDNVGIFLREKRIPKTINIASVNTLFAHKKKFLSFFEDVRVLILDECQLSSSDTWHLLSLLCTKAEYRFGFSATPYTGNPVKDLTLIGQTGKEIIKVTSKQLVDMGVSAQPYIFMPVFRHSGNYLIYQDAISKGIVENEKRNELIRDLVYGEIALNAEIRILIIVSRTRHGEILNEMINGSVFVSGKTKVKDRDTLFAKQIVIATSIADFGLDADIDVCFLAGSGRGKASDKEPIRPMQRLGRGQRRKRGKRVIVLYDILDENERYLNSHAKERKKAWESEDFPPIICKDLETTIEERLKVRCL